ncbi:MAG: glycosyltransferase family 4 protein, partial [Polyangiaceae bacterium]
MHVLLVSMEIDERPATGGVAAWVGNAARALVRRGHRVTVIARTCDSKTLEEVDGFTIHRILPPILRRLGLARHLGVGLRSYAREVVRAIDRVHALSPVDVLGLREARAEGIYAVSDRRFPSTVHLHGPFELADR